MKSYILGIATGFGVTGFLVLGMTGGKAKSAFVLMIFLAMVCAVTSVFV